MGWNDLGSWEEISLRRKNKHKGMIEENASGNFYSNQNETPKTVAFLGVSDLIAVDSPDALLIMRKGEGQNVKSIVDKLKAQDDTKALTQTHNFEDRPWGRYEVLLDTDHFKSKRIWVWPKQKLSYQSHNKRAEHWIMTQGEAEVTLNDQVHKLKAGEHIYIPLQAKHRIYNPGDSPLEFIEVQTGTYFGEDDIIRYSDDYGRT
jgi:mannose-1-phosphate guanylyltransferase/mannose-1-phosphate guanylyltransferase/mannose-6-phosphate isomerase